MAAEFKKKLGLHSLSSSFSSSSVPQMTVAYQNAVSLPFFNMCEYSCVINQSACADIVFLNSTGSLCHSFAFCYKIDRSLYCEFSLTGFVL